MSYLSDLLGNAYKEGMTEEEISTALQSAGAGAKDNEAEVNRLKAQLSKANSEAADYKKQLGRLEKGWRYQGDPGTNGEVIATGKHAGEIHTYGNPANMSMYYTVRELEEKFEEIARRVYRR